MYNKAITIRFRQPKSNEFGHTYCLDSVLYLELDREDISIGLSLKNLRNKSTIWHILQNPIIGFTKDMTVPIDTFVKDGSYEVDDLELEHKSLLSVLNCENNISYTDLCKNVDEVLTGQSQPKIVVFTKNTKKADLLQEIKKWCSLKDKEDFNKVFEWLTKERFENITFLSKKQLAMQLLPDLDAAKGLVQIEIALNNYWNAKLGDKSSVLITDVLPLTDDEVVTYFKLKVTALKIVDERALVPHNPTRADITKDTKLYIGSVNLTTIPYSFLLIGKSHKDDKGTALLRIDASADYKLLQFSCISEIKIKSTTKKLTENIPVDVAQGDKICNVAKRIRGIDKNDVPSKVHRLPIDLIDQVLQESVTELSKLNWNKAINRFELIPLSEKCEFVGSEESMTATIDIGVQKEMCTNIAVSAPENASLSHLGLNDFESHVNSLIQISSLGRQLCGSIKCNNPPREARVADLSNALGVLYAILKPFLAFHWYVALGCPKINRAFIILDNQQAAKQTFVLDGKLNFSVIPSPGIKVEKGNVVTVVPHSSALNYIISLKRAAKTWDNAKKHAKLAMDQLAHSVKNAQAETKVLHIHKVLSAAIVSAYQERNEIVPTEALDLYDGSKEDRPRFKFLSSEGEADIDLKYIDKCNIYAVLMNAALTLMVENDTFLDLKGSDESIIIPSDAIQSTLRDEFYTKLLLVKSMYA